MSLRGSVSHTESSRANAAALGPNQWLPMIAPPPRSMRVR
jgi:hypothetical protein